MGTKKQKATLKRGAPCVFWDAPEKESQAGARPDQGSQEHGVSNSVLGSSSVEGTAFCPRKPQSSTLSKGADKARAQEVTAHTGGPGMLGAQKDGWDPPSFGVRATARPGAPTRPHARAAWEQDSGLGKEAGRWLSHQQQFPSQLFTS
ncbi:unnamed protein product, partial [Rangifer tarandus platyrhynchus]